MPSLLDLRRTVSALVAVAMSAALIAFAFIISDSFRTQTQTSARVSVGDAAVVVQDGVMSLDMGDGSVSGHG